MKDYLVDTNILIYYFASAIPENELNKIEKIFDESFTVSVITQIEFLGWDKHTEKGFENAKEFLNQANVITITDDIADLAIRIRRSSKIKLPDAVIAATSLNDNFILVTRNDKDFRNVPDLEIYNPFHLV